MREVSAHVKQALEELDRGVVILTDKNQVRWCTRRVRVWMSEYFEPLRQAEYLPESLQRWVERQRLLLSKDGGVPPPRKPLVVEQPGKRLVVRLVADPPNDRHLLLLEEHAPFAAKCLRSLGLTCREEEILLWVARGKTDKEVAALLYISPRTVIKHLPHIYDKLGVESRTEAMVRALETLGLLRR